MQSVSPRRKAIFKKRIFVRPVKKKIDLWYNVCWWGEGEEEEKSTQFVHLSNPGQKRTYLKFNHRNLKAK